MRISKKILAIALSILMAVSMMPFTVFAATANLSDILASASGKYVEITDTDIVVDADTTLTGHILDLYGDVSIDLNGHNLVAGAANSSGQEVAIWINPSANVTITDSAQPSTAATYSTTTGDLTIKSGVAAISSTYYGIINEGNLTLGKAVVKGDDNAICVTAGGTLTTTEANSIVCGGTYGVTYPGGTATLNLTKGMIFGQYGLSGNSSFDSTTNAYKFGGNTINIGAAKIYGKGIDDDGSGVINGAAIVLGADDDCNITGSATIYGYDAPAIVVRASADLDITGSPSVKTYGTVTDVKVLDGATAVPSAPVVVDTACGYTKKEAIDVDIAGGTYEATATGVTNAVALLGESGQTTADYVTVTGGSYKANGASDTSVADLIPAASGEETPKVYDNGKVVDALFEVNGNYYAHITQAINSVPTDGTATTIKLLKDVSDSGYGGCVVNSGQNVTFDLDGHTWTLRGTVGSTGTKTNGFQFLQGSTVKIKDGTITAKLATIYHVIQNYGDLTIEDATVQYTSSGVNKVAVSTNSSSTVIKNSTISVNSDGSATEPNYAIDVNPGWGGYTAADVVIENATINGNVCVEATAANSTADVEFKGTTSFTRGEIVMSDATNGTTEVKNTGTGVVAPEGYEWVDGETAGTQVLAEDTHTVAKIGDAKYDTLKEAFAAAVDGDTITLVQDCDGDGIVVPQSKFNTNGLTVDFNGFTYDISGNPVGSTGTETLGFQLLKDNKLTFKDGAITTSNHLHVLRVIQNYSDLTLDNMDISMKGAYYDEKTVSNANGTMNIVNGSTVNAPDYSWIDPSYTDSSVFGGEALTVGTFSTYTAATVNVEDSTINGDLSVDVDNPATSTNTVNLTSGTLTGDIKMLDNASADTVEVNKENTFSQDPAQGYKWVDNNDGTSTLEKIDNGYSVTVDDKIAMNIYLDLDSYGADSATFTFNNNDNGDPTGTGNLTVTKTKSQLQKQVGGEYDGCYYFTIVQAPAQMADTITVNIKENGNVVDTITTSVADYLIQASASSDVALANLAKAMYDYGKAVCSASFAMGDYVGGNNFTHAYFNDAAMSYTDVTGYVFNIDNSGSTQSANNMQFGFSGAALVATSVPTFRVMFNFTEDQWKNYYGDNCSTAKCSKYGESSYTDLNLAVSEASGQVCVDLGSIMPEDFNQVYELNFDNATMSVNVLGYAAAAIKTGSEMGNEDGAKIVDLGRSIYNYYVAAAAYFV